MDDPAVIILNEDGTTTTHDEVPAKLAAALLASHKSHGGIFWVPNCPHCQARWPEGRGWGE